MKIKTKVELDKAQIAGALREWAEKVQGLKVARVRVVPHLESVGYGMAERDEPGVYAEIECDTETQP